MSAAEYIGLIGPVARELLGEPNAKLSSRTELRFGTHGSLSVDLEKGVWYDHEAEEGGGVLALVTRETGRQDGKAWLVERGYLSADAPRSESPAAVYDYCDENGEILFQVVRKPGHVFLQRRPDGAGGWVWNVRGVRQVPYRLPELLAAAEDELVFVVEGEKDADNLRALGFVATCNAGGATKWRACHSGHLRGRDVVILPDNDEPGRAHARKVRECLAGIARSVCVVELPGLPPKGDVSDWIAGGGTAEALLALVQKARSVQKDAGEFVHLRSAADIRCEPIEWLWPGFLPKGKLVIKAGAPGSGKTTIAMQEVATVTTGGRWPDGTRAPVGNVLIWSGEDDPADTLVPRLKAAGADVSRVFFVGDNLTDDEPRPFDPATDMPVLEMQAERIGNVALTVLDPIVSAVQGDSHKNSEVRRALQPVVTYAARTGSAVLGISHFTKGTAGRDPTERVTGSVAFGALARLVMVTAKGEDGSRLLARAKSNIGPDGGGFAYALEVANVDGVETTRIRWGEALEGTARELLGNAEVVQESPRESAAQWLADMLSGAEVPVKTLRTEANAAGLSWRTVERAKAEIGAIAERISVGNDGAGRWYWRLPDKTANPTTNYGGLGKNWRSSDIHLQERQPLNGRSGGLASGGLAMGAHHD